MRARLQFGYWQSHSYFSRGGLPKLIGSSSCSLLILIFHSHIGLSAVEGYSQHLLATADLAPGRTPLDRLHWRDGWTLSLSFSAPAEVGGSGKPTACKGTVRESDWRLHGQRQSASKGVCVLA